MASVSAVPPLPGYGTGKWSRRLPPSSLLCLRVSVRFFLLLFSRAKSLDRLFVLHYPFLATATQRRNATQGQAEGREREREEGNNITSY